MQANVTEQHGLEGKERVKKDPTRLDYQGKRVCERWREKIRRNQRKTINA
jgi:hypothetical protein